MEPAIQALLLGHTLCWFCDCSGHGSDCSQRSSGKLLSFNSVKVAKLLQVFYFEEFGITNVWQQGLLNGAPYLCSVLIGCWTNAPLNKLFGRRGTIFISCWISFISSFWMAAAHTYVDPHNIPAMPSFIRYCTMAYHYMFTNVLRWWNLLLARFLLGLAVGAKSSTTPVYAAESAPKNIRGALTMMWQMYIPPQQSPFTFLTNNATGGQHSVSCLALSVASLFKTSHGQVPPVQREQLNSPLGGGC